MKRLTLLVPIAFVVLLLTGAQEAGAPTLQLSEDGGFGAHLVDAEGATLYAYLEDSEGASACVDRCVDNWPPLTVEGEPTAGEGLDASLLGTLQRDDGTTQVTYGGHPLYRYARDANAGDMRGQALGEAFYVVSPAGETVSEAVAASGAPAADVDQETFDALMSEGAPVFATNCAACHGNEGQGQIGPRLAGNSNMSRGDFVITRVINGFVDHGMPPFGDQLSDRQIAAVVTHVRNSWGNEYGAVTEEEVSALR